MNLRNTILVGGISALVGISALYRTFNHGGGPVRQQNFHVGFLPVT